MCLLCEIYSVIIRNTGVQNRNDLSSLRTKVSVKIWATNTYTIPNTDTYLISYKNTA